VLILSILMHDDENICHTKDGLMARKQSATSNFRAMLSI
tara:strand:- start:101 stop:217 length:117 start_codon:yes stop_codon:yes gene_type:complete